MRGFGPIPPGMPNRATPSPPSTQPAPHRGGPSQHTTSSQPATAPARAAQRSQSVGTAAAQQVQSIRQGANRATMNQVAATQHFAHTGVQTPAAPMGPATTIPQRAVPATMPGRPAAGQR